jgi:hypothetical protein
MVVLTMNVNRLNIYKRLRDFKVPASILDDIFSEEKDILVLETAWEALIKDGFKQDDAANEISKMIFKELDDKPNQSLDDEK